MSNQPGEPIQKDNENVKQDQLLKLEQDQNNQSQQQSSNKKNNRPQQYQKVDERIRKAIVDQVYTKGYPLRQIAQTLGIKYSTAKAILQVYQSEGRIGKKNTRDKRVFTQIESYLILINKKTGKIDKLKLKSESSELRNNLKQNQQKLEEEHYSQLAETLIPYMEESKMGTQPTDQIKDLMSVLNEQLNKLQQQ